MSDKGVVGMLKGYKNRNATARCIYSFCLGTKNNNSLNNVETFEGSVEGKIVDVPEPKAQNDTWYSIFKPNGANKTFDEMRDDEFRMVSHRKQAMQGLYKFLMYHSDSFKK